MAYRTLTLEARVHPTLGVEFTIANQSHTLRQFNPEGTKQSPSFHEAKACFLHVCKDGHQQWLISADYPEFRRHSGGDTLLFVRGTTTANDKKILVCAWPEFVRIQEAVNAYNAKEAPKPVESELRKTIKDFGSYAPSVEALVLRLDERYELRPGFTKGVL